MGDTTGIYRPGVVIDGRYRIDRQLGRGGFATVYHAHHLNLDRPAALKILEPVAAEISERFRRRFTTEARIAANLDHPNVVRIFDFGFVEPDDRPYIAMEVLPGQDLEEYMRDNGSLTPRRAKPLFEGVLDALRVGHERGIIHKDLKPANLYFVDPNTPRERLVVLDFGIARMETAPDTENNTRLTEEGTYTGTPQYMAPEYIHRREVLPATDVYQLGLIFVEAMTGQPVVHGATAIACMVAHVEGKHRIPDDFGDTPLGRALLKALAVDPSERYANAGEMLRAVRDANVARDTDFTLPAITVEEMPEFDPASGPAADDVEPADDSLQQPPQLSKPRNRTPIYLALGLFVVLGLCATATAIGAATYFLISSSDVSELYRSDRPELPGRTRTPSGAEQPGVLDIVRTPGNAAEAQEIYGWVLARYALYNSLYQIDLYQKSYTRAGGWKENPSRIATVEPGQMFDLARQQIRSSMDKPPGREKLEDAANAMLEDLDGVQKLTTQLNDYHSIRKGWESDGGARGEKLHRRLQTRLKPLRESWRRFDRLVDVEVRNYLDAREAGQESDEFLSRATTAMRAAHRTIDTAGRNPMSDAANEAIAELDGAIDELQDYADANRQTLAKRYSPTMGVHRRFIDSLKETRKRAGELSSKAESGNRRPGDAVFLNMQLQGNLQAYNLLLRW